MSREHMFDSHVSRSMETPKIAELWQALRASGLECLAPTLVQLRVRSLDDVTCRVTELSDAGVLQWQIEAIIAARGKEEPQRLETSAGRSDHPVPFAGRRASLAAALEAAQPNNRKRSLATLDADILAKSTTPSQESKVRTYRALCAAWDVDPWPISPTNVRCVSASFKIGGYRSAAGYFQAVMGYQQRHLRTDVDSLTRRCVKDCIRSIRRGLGSQHLKDSFDASLLGDFPGQEDSDATPFSFDSLEHIKDMCILGIWFMLRENELSSAKMADLQLEANEVRMTVPVHKTDSYGTLCSRTLRCCCRIRQSGLCPWHAGERHLVRLSLHPKLTRSYHLPLFPTDQGVAASKYMMIQAFRRMIAATGTPTTRSDPQARDMQRFSGHVLRVSGAQLLASSGIAVQLIQLLGRWTSQAVMRYVQEAHMVQLPNLPLAVVGSREQLKHNSELRLSMAADLAAVAHSSDRGASDEPQLEETEAGVEAPPAKTFDLSHLQAQIDAIQLAIQKPQQAYVARHRGKVLHIGMLEELHTPPQAWKTRCGWSYGLTNFIRLSEIHVGTRRCQKCFGLSEDQDSEDESDSSSVSSSSGSEDDDEWSLFRSRKKIVQQCPVASRVFTFLDPFNSFPFIFGSGRCTSQVAVRQVDFVSHRHGQVEFTHALVALLAVMFSSVVSHRCEIIEISSGLMFVHQITEDDDIHHLAPFSFSSCKSAVPDADHGNAVFGRCGPGGGRWRWDQEVSRSPWHQNHGHPGLVGHQLGTAGPCLGQAFDGRMASRRIEPDHFDTIRAADCHGDIAPHVVGVQVFVVEDASSGNTSLISDGYTTFITCEWIGSASSRRESSEATPTWSMEQAPSQLWAATDRWPQQDLPCAGSPGGRASPRSAPLGTWDFEVVHTGETRWALGTSHLSPVGGNQPSLQEGALWQHLGDLRQQAGSTGRDKLAAQECAGHPWWIGFHQVGLHFGGPWRRGTWKQKAWSSMRRSPVDARPSHVSQHRLPQNGRAAPRSMKGKFDPLVKSRWLSDGRCYAPWQYNNPALMKTPTETLVTPPAFVKEQLHHLPAGWTEDPNIPDRSRHRMIANSWHAGVARFLFMLWPRLKANQTPTITHRRWVLSSGWPTRHPAILQAWAQDHGDPHQVAYHRLKENFTGISQPPLCNSEPS